MDRLRRLATRAAATTLCAVPGSTSDQDGSPESVPEPMLDGVAYDNLSYREPIGYSGGATTYAPPIGDPPRRIELVRDGSGAAGSLILADGERQFVLADHVIAVSFTRAGNELSIELAFAPSHGAGGTIVDRISVPLHGR
jgi:hypothetical protein